jgi:hypothetical protein
LIQRFQLGQQLGRRFEPWHAAEQFDDVAKLAQEWTAATELHSRVKVSPQFD